MLNIPESFDRLCVLEALATKFEERIAEALQRDEVVLLRGVDPDKIDNVISNVCSALDLLESLELQSGFASMQGHRRNVGKFFQTVNRRDSVEFIPPHSEGRRREGMQLSAFYCHENSTDGGHTVVMRANQAASLWSKLRDSENKAMPSARSFTAYERALIKGMYSISLTDDVVQDGDQVISVRDTRIAGFRMAEVISSPKTSYSKILSTNVFTYWESMATIDRQCGLQFSELLQSQNLIVRPPSSFVAHDLNNARQRELYDSGLDLSPLFSERMTIKLSPRDFIIQNNMTWAHGVSNWNPGSGTRSVIAAFA